MGDIIGGTVIQRSFIGRESSNILHIATVPVSELGMEHTSPTTILAEILGIPVSSVLDDDSYRRVTDYLQKYPSDYFFPIWNASSDRYFSRLYDSLRGDESQKQLFSDFLAASGGMHSLGYGATLWLPFSDPDVLSDIGVNQDAMASALQCLGSRASRSRQTNAFIEEVFEYDIPLGQSPAVKADSLLALLETSKKVCLAPLALGGAQGVTQLTQGNYVAAILTTGTAGVMTLILIGTVSVGTIIVQKVAQMRGRGKQT